MVKTSVTYRHIWQIAYPIILGSVAQNVINVTDTIFLGRVGVIALGAGAIGGIFYLAMTMFGWGFGVGTQIIVARRNGENKEGEIGKTIDHALIFMVLLSVLIFFLIKYFAPVFLKKSLESKEVFAASAEFLNYRAYGIFFAFLNFLYRAFYIGIGKTKVISWTTAFMASVNVFLDYGLIFGNFGFPRMEIKGAAIASVCAEISAFVFFTLYTLKNISFKQYCLFQFKMFQLWLFRRIVTVSVPVMLQYVISLGGWFLFFMFVERLGEGPLAISNIIRSVYVVLLVPIFGLASATNTMVSHLIGEGKRNEVMSLIWKISRLSAFLVIVIVFLGLLVPRQILGLYSTDALLVQHSIPVLHVVSGAALFLAVAFILFNGVSGTGKTMISFIIEMGVIIVYLFATYLIASSPGARVEMVWTVEYLYGILMGSISWLYLRFGNWQHSRV